MCLTCDKSIPRSDSSPFATAVKMAEIEAKAENKMYVVVYDNGRYYHECYECRKKNPDATGTIEMYVV